MNPIKEFFRRKKTERKFDKAGPGHRLDQNAPNTSKKVSPVGKGHPAQGRPQPTADARRAGAAALARFEQKKETTVNWSAAAIKAQAKKELEQENSQIKPKNAPIEVNQDACPALSVSGVYFTCPIIGPEILPKNEIEKNIKEFLNEQLSEERGLTACLIIHTCNKDKKRVSLGVETLIRYLTNILDNPTEPKFHKIRLKNKVFQERISGLEGALDFLSAAGFQHQVIKQGDEDEEFYVFPEENLGDLENLQILKDALLCSEPIVPVLDRNLKVLLPTQVTEQLNLPPEFFNLSAEELQREQEAKTEAVELGKTLRTKAMRERDEKREIHMYRFTLIRIRFPDDIILQGTFHIYEKLSAVRSFITENLTSPERTFNLLVPGGIRLAEDDHTLLDLKLVPAAILNFQWGSDISLDEHVSYLSLEAMSLLENL